MSRIYFHSPSGETELAGAERAYMGYICSEVALALVDLDSPHVVDRLVSLLDPTHRLSTDARSPFMGTTSVVDAQWQQRMRSALAHSIFGSPLMWKGQRIATFSLVLNTALAVGGDAIKLAARLHGQCEIHTYVEGPNRSWLAGIMRQGLDSNIFRKGLRGYSMGWENVIDFLLARDDEPVVTSYSVCDSFPNKSVGDWMPAWPEGVPRKWDLLTEEQQAERGARGEEWYDLDKAEQWRISLAGLRASEGLADLKPDNWQTMRFRHCLSFLDLLEEDFASRLDNANLDIADGQE